MADSDNKDIFNLEGDALDAALMAAIEETDEEERQAKEEKVRLNQERAEKARLTAIADEQKKAKIEELRKSLPNEGRRYFLMAEEVSADESKLEVSLTGNLFGCCKKDDNVFIYRHDGRAIGSKVTSIEEYNGAAFEPADEVSGKRARITCSIDFEKIGFSSEDAVPKFAVLSSVRPPLKEDGKKALVENPGLSGMLFGFSEFKKDKDYMNRLTTNLVNGRFLAAAFIEGTNENGKPRFNVVMISSKEKPEKKVIPVFTDIQALMMWKDIFAGEKKPTAVPIPYAEAAKLSDKEGFDIMINPFGPAKFILPVEVVRMISSQIKKNAGTKIGKETVNDGSKVVVGQLRPGEESDRIREALRNYCSGNRDIKRAGVMFMIRNGRTSYLVVVDAPKTSQKVVFPGILAALKPHLKDIRYVDLSIYSEAPFAKEFFEKTGWDYSN